MHRNLVFLGEPHRPDLQHFGTQAGHVEHFVIGDDIDFAGTTYQYIPGSEIRLETFPGSMADPAYVVMGKGCDAAINSASHGAGRVMSRTAAFKRFSHRDLKNILAKTGVTLISAGLDEIPMAYKNIDAVMSQQKGLVETLARFEPKLVKMAPSESGRSRRSGKRRRKKKHRHR